MENWINTDLQLLNRSLKPIPQELNEIDWKSGLSDKSERLAQHISALVSMASKIISETIEAGLIKSSNPENASKKFASYVPFWA